MPYTAPISEFQFLFDHIVGFDAVAATSRFAEADSDTVAAILDEAGKLCTEVMAPLQRVGDVQPARLENGFVRTPEGFGEAYNAIAEGGWLGISATPDFGGMGLPQTVATAVNDMMSGACLSLQLCPLLSQGQIDALEHHASDELRALYLPKLISGEWTGTMNLTEPQAGSDVGALTSKAEPVGDGTFRVSGQKIYITYGDHDMADNVCHLVLARLPDGGAGTKGISLFLVPKLLPDAQGKPGVANTLKVVSLEHKLGLHGCPTAVMQYDEAIGWMVGEPHKGMAAMFTMMNNARLGVGVQGVGIADAAYQQALAYAMDRQQGPTPLAAKGGIVDHADVRRMLMTMKADLFAARAATLSCAVAIDMAKATEDPTWTARAAWLTPITKAFGTEVGKSVADTGIQVHGGMGFIEETGAAQYYRDVRVTPIYEGTNGIQAMDLVSRKLADGGAAAFSIIDEIQDHAQHMRANVPHLALHVWNAAEALREATEGLLQSESLNDRFAVAVPYLTGAARVLGGHYHLKASAIDPDREALARFYIHRMLPEHGGLFAQVTQGAEDLYALTPEALAS